MAATGYAWTRAARSGQVGPFGLALRLIGGVLLVGFVWLLVQALASEGGRPGSLIVTLIFVVVGIALQYLLGLGLALLAVQQVPWRRFFRVVFLIPLTITPVGVGYMFLMLTDTVERPARADLGRARAARLHLGDRSLAGPGCRDHRRHVAMDAVRVHRAAGRAREPGPGSARGGPRRRRQSLAGFRHITFPALLPVTTTIILIRLIEGFKIIDMPNILLGGGPGTATQSMTLQAYIDWNTLNLGRSAAVAYLLLLLVTIVATVVRQPGPTTSDGDRYDQPVPPTIRDRPVGAGQDRGVPAAVSAGRSSCCSRSTGWS